MTIFEHLESIDETIETIRYEQKRDEVFNNVREFDSDDAKILTMEG